MTKTMTYSEALQCALDLFATLDLTQYPARATEAVDRLKALKASVDKRNASKSAGERKPTKTQKENEVVKADLLTHLSAEGKTCKDIAGEMGLSVQKVSALLKQLVDAGKAVRSEGKGKVSLFTIAQ